MFKTGQYGFEERDGGDDGRLVIILSQSKKPVFKNIDYGATTIFVWEKQTTYYTRRALRAVRGLSKYISKRGFVSVCFVGCSKAGYGALLWASLLARESPKVSCAAIAFSPQTRLYPENDRLVFPSYKNLLSVSENNSGVLEDLKRHGSIGEVSELKNLKIKIIYPERVEEDRLEAAQCVGPNVEHISLPLSTHTTIIPFVSDASDPDVVKSKVRALLKSIPNDGDVASFAKIDQFDKLVEEYLLVGAQPSLSELIYEISTPYDKKRGFLMSVKRFFTLR